MKKILTLIILGFLLSGGAKGAWADGPYPAPMTDGTFGPVGVATPASQSGPASSINEFELYSAVNLLLGTSYSNNAQLSSQKVTSNTSTFTQGTNAGYVVIGLGAANTNTLQVYNAATPGTLINPLGESFSGNGPTGDGTIASPYVGTGAAFSTGTQFGFALNTVGTDNINVSDNGSNNTWYSDPTLNSDLMDHIVVYNLSELDGQQVYIRDPNTGVESLVTLENPYLIGFEDIPLDQNGARSDMDFNDMTFLVSGGTPFTSTVPEPKTWALLFAGLIGMAVFTRRQPVFGW